MKYYASNNNSTPKHMKCSEKSKYHISINQNTQVLFGILLIMRTSSIVLSPFRSNQFFSFETKNKKLLSLEP